MESRRTDSTDYAVLGLHFFVRDTSMGELLGFDVHLQNRYTDALGVRCCFSTRQGMVYEQTMACLLPWQCVLACSRDIVCVDRLSEKPVFRFVVWQGEREFGHWRYHLKPQGMMRELNDMRLAGRNFFVQELRWHQREKPVRPTLPPLKLSSSVYTQTRQDWFPKQRDFIVDLHIGKDVTDDDVCRFGTYLNAQKNVFEYRFWQACNHKQNRLTVIHGKGDGVLRSAVHRFLREHRKYFSRYEEDGQGGTRIFF